MSRCVFVYYIGFRAPNSLCSVYSFLFCSGIEQPKEILSLQQINSTKIKREDEEVNAEVTMVVKKIESKKTDEKKRCSDNIDLQPAVLHDNLKEGQERLTAVLTLDINSTGSYTT